MNREKLPTKLLPPCEIKMKDPFILKILDLFSFLFSRQNISYDQVRLIMKLKLLQDRRKPSSMFKNLRPIKNKDSNMFLLSLFFFVLMGLLFLAIIAEMSLTSLLIANILFFTIIMLIVSYVIIIEFSLDLFDTSDHVILLSKPIGFKELNVAKSLHVFLYISAISTAMSLPTLVFWAIQFNIFVSIVAYVFVILSLFFLLYCSAQLYSLILGKFSGERLKDTISMFQIVSIIVIFVGSQLFIHASEEWFSKLEITGIPTLLYFLPSTWFALPSYMVGSNSFSLTGSLVVLAGLLITIFGYRYYLYHLAPDFEKNLYKMSVVNTKISKRKELLALKFARLMKNNLNRAFYKFSVIMLSRERRLKQAIYPTMAMGFIYPALIIYISISDPDIIIAETEYFFFFYFAIVMMLQLSIYTNFSEYHKASWLYYYLPLKSPGNIILGAKMAMLVCYQSVCLIITGLLFLIFWKFTITFDVIIMLLNALIIQLIYQDISKRVLPFSEEIKTGRNTAFLHFSYYLAAFVFTPLAAMIHYLMHSFLPVLAIPFIIIQVAALYFLIKNHYNIKWDEI